MTVLELSEASTAREPDGVECRKMVGLLRSVALSQDSFDQEMLISCPRLPKMVGMAMQSYIPIWVVHFRRIIAPHTDTNLGDCSSPDTCRHMKTCKYVHYELDATPNVATMMMGAASLPPPKPIKPQRAEYCSEVELGEPQWINCDIHTFRMDILGQFGVIMADPPWDIHMELPYGTMADDEM